MPYSSFGRPATALSATLAISGIVHPRVRAVVAGDELRRQVGIIRRQPPLEQVRWLDHVVVG